MGLKIGGSVGSFFERTKNTVKKNINTDALNDFVSFAVGAAAMGSIKYDPSTGKTDLRAPAAWRWTDEAVGEVSGRNMTRKAMREADKQLAAEKAAMDKELRDKRLFDYRMDVNASRNAEAIRKTSQSRLKASSSDNSFGETDFLGLA
jgi:hypothetical protein